jgi:hypothetical protein
MCRVPSTGYGKVPTTRDHEGVVALAEGLNPEAYPYRSRRSAYWADYGRALVCRCSPWWTRWTSTMGYSCGSTNSPPGSAGGGDLEGDGD